jgi:carbonic anhydrase
MTERNPDFFPTLSRQQAPDYLWIGCSDSRAPANDIVGLLPGELFVHRNVANVVVHSDMNCMAVLEFAVEQLGVKHIIVCGHYGCGGVRAALGDRELGLIDNWLRHIKDVYRANEGEMRSLGDMDAAVDRLCELNVIAQVHNVCHTTIVQNAWSRGQDLAVHGVIYGLSDGRLKDLGVAVEGPHAIDSIYHMRLPEQPGA